MELRHLRYFIAVAEELNFRRAAERLHISQPPLTTQLQQLEEEIGVKLLERDSHHVTLTAAGGVFLQSCRQLLRDADAATQGARRAAHGETGRLAIGFIPSLAHDIVPSLLRDLSAPVPRRRAGPRGNGYLSAVGRTDGPTTGRWPDGRMAASRKYGAGFGRDSRGAAYRGAA